MIEEVESWYELARQLGCKPQRISWHVHRRPDAPKEKNVQLWRDYLAANSRTSRLPDPNSKVSKQTAKTKLAILKAVRLDKERKNRNADAEIYDAGEVTQFLTLLQGFMFSELDRLSKEYPVTLKGSSEVAIFEKCTEQNERIKDALRSQLEKWRNTP